MRPVAGQGQRLCCTRAIGGDVQQRVETSAHGLAALMRG